MNCYGELLKHLPGLANSKAMLVGFVNTRQEYDQILYVGNMLMTPYGKVLVKNFTFIHEAVMTVKEQAGED